MHETSMQNLIGGHHRISAQLGALSLVRKFNASHAYLILEQYDQGKRITRDIHLVIKRETENIPQKKADIVDRDRTVADLLELVYDKLHSITWSVTQEQMEQFEVLLEQEKKRVANNQIDYQMVGNASAAGLFGASLQTAQSESVKAWSIKHQQGSASEFLLRSGHNCYSWAQGMVMNIGVKPPTIWNEFFVKDPRKVLVGEAVVGEEREPTTLSNNNSCCIL